MPGSPKRQHFIPQLHLKHFVGDNPKGQVWTYDAVAGTARSATTENTAVVSYFYSAETTDGAIDGTIDDFITKIEGIAAPIYEALLRGEFPKDGSQERADFSVFLALMYVRTPAMRRMSAEVHGRGLQITNYAYGSNLEAFATLMRNIEEEEGTTFDEEAKERFRQGLLDPTQFVFQIPKEHTLHVMGIADNLAPIFFNMKWAILRPAHGFFITSDNPLVREVDPKTRSPFYGDGGFANRTAEIIFPLSPKALLFMSWNKFTQDVASCSRDYADRVNRAFAAHSDRYLYAHIHHKRLEQLAAEFKDTRPGMTTQAFGPKKFGAVEVMRRPKRTG